MHVLDFEKPIAELEKKIEELKQLSASTSIDVSDEIRKLAKKARRLTNDIFSRLSGWQRTLLARHPDRPHALDYVKLMLSDFLELHGDRLYRDDPAILGGFATLDDIAVMVIGQEKGRDTKEKIARNFGMPHPEGYRKALRLMKLAEKFARPVVTLIDTPGAYPGLEAESRGQAEAIARSLKDMARLKVPVVAAVIGEGGSGGALAVGVANRVLMLENATYSVISSEGCAAILWNDNGMADKAAEALRLTAKDLLAFRLIDEVIKEPLGGAHRNYKRTASILRRALRRHIKELWRLGPEALQRQRREKFRHMGVFAEK